MNDFPFWFEWLFKGMCAILGFFGIRTLNRIDDDMKALQQKQIAYENSTRENASLMVREHAEHRVYCEREFERKDTVQASLARIHDRLDELFQLVAGKQ